MTHKQRKVAEAKSDVIRDIPAACASEPAAVEFMERRRWPDGVHCPRCGSSRVKQIIAKDGTRGSRFLWRCYGCTEEKRPPQFSWRVGSIAEDSRIPARWWVFAFWRCTTSKKGYAAKELQRQSGLSYKASLFLLHRIRFAMTDTPPENDKLTGTVVSDETFIGGRARYRNWGRENSRARKSFVVALHEKGGRLRAQIIPNITSANVGAVLRKNVAPSARLHTDESFVYQGMGKKFAAHETVNHSIFEFARGDVSTNLCEGWFGLLKRQLNGIHHAVSKEHLDRYVQEAAWRYNHRGLEDGARLTAAVQAGEGKRLTYKPTSQISA